MMIISHVLVHFSDKMAVPPAYADLGKAAKDIFNKGYGKVLYFLLKTIKLHGVVVMCYNFFVIMCLIRFRNGEA